MTWERQRAYDFDAGKEAASIENAKNLLKLGVAPETIAEGCSLPLEQVLAIKEELKSESLKFRLPDKFLLLLYLAH
ncbi:hypothetical protein DYE50_03490 [Treponema ruminis]|uniref:Uncharacterized protein n=1 Tax=Treponema ruminis TaxID=744515 RepID=A0A7W8G7V8_9SPIR|nr:hypothetical protein [Treponema ruminis]MBB5225488.1 hypothetical protein [Treponema ruminis]QSI01642.1 hypothetical protein DYE50_03490 [Treponema ruminis]